MRLRPLAQRVLFDEAQVVEAPPLPPQLRVEVLQLMVQWMQSVAQAMSQEVGDEQDHR